MSADLAARHAPIIVLHPSERFAPMSAAEFIAQSQLVWRQSDTKWKTLVETGDVEPARLGVTSDAPYVHVENGVEVSATELTRPFEGNVDDRVAELPIGKGFALVNDEASPGEVETSFELERRVALAPMYYEIQQADGTTRICYWLFFGSSSLPASWLEAIARRAADRVGDWFSAFEDVMPGRRRAAVQPEVDLPDLWGLAMRRHAHEGDWEGVTVELSASGELAQAHFRAHHGGHFTAAEQLPAGRLTVYCSLGSHACFESPDSPNNADGDDIPGEGISWDPLAPASQLLDVTSEHWYGFGGAWGDPGLDDRLHLDIRRRDLAGPLGPSRYKRIWPEKV